MGSMIGPITLTVGQPYKVSLAQDTAYIELQNDSLYDVWVFFGEVEPTDLTNANNTWHRVVRRQHNGVIPVEGYRGASAAERRNNTIGAFKGTVWLLAVNPGGLALTGTISGRSQVYLTPYAQGDSLPAHSSLSTQTDLSSQPRIISVPIVPTYYATGTWAASGTDLDMGVQPLSQTVIANGIAFFYVYAFRFYAEVSGAASQQGLAFTINALVKDSGGVVLGSSPIYNGYLFEQNSTAQWISNQAAWESPYPLQGIVAAPANAYGLSFAVHARSFNAGLVMSYNFAAGIDQVNQSAPGSIGAQFGIFSPSNPTLY